MAGRKYTYEEAKAELDKWKLGQTSEKYESGNRGPGTISSGDGDNGGKSYGRYQIETKKGTMNEYLQYSNNYNGHFNGLKPATPAFDAKWKELAATDTEAFSKSQHNFIIEHHYMPELQKLEDRGYDFSTRGKAIQDMVWSTSVQYRKLLPRVIQRAERESGLNFQTATDAEIITAVQNSKLKHVEQDFRSNKPEVRQSVRNRIPREKNSLLHLNELEEIVNSQQQQQEKSENIAPALSPRAEKLSQQCENKLIEYCNKHDITATEPSDFKNISMALTNHAIKAGMSKVESLTIDDNWKVSIFSHEPDLRYASVMASDAVKIPAEQSMLNIQNSEQELAQQRNNQIAQNQPKLSM
nr:hypothetical protein [uncultured Kingella sp.]